VSLRGRVWCRLAGWTPGRAGTVVRAVGGRSREVQRSDGRLGIELVTTADNLAKDLLAGEEANQQTKELTEVGDLGESVGRRPSVCLAIPALTASPESVTDTFNYCAYVNDFPSLLKTSTWANWGPLIKEQQALRRGSEPVHVFKYTLACGGGWVVLASLGSAQGLRTVQTGDCGTKKPQSYKW
jgi:hypothetical protein